VKRSRKSVSESGCTPISEKSAAICSSVALNDRLPTYNFFTAVLLLRGARGPAQNTRLKGQEIGRAASESDHARLKRALQLLRSILLQ